MYDDVYVVGFEIEGVWGGGECGCVVEIYSYSRFLWCGFCIVYYVVKCGGWIEVGLVDWIIGFGIFEGVFIWFIIGVVKCV